MALASPAGTTRKQRFAALVCILLVLLLLGVEAVHSHSLTAGVSTSNICLLCNSAQTTVPVTAMVSQISLIALGTLAVARELKRQPQLAGLEVFIRPPPTV